MRKIVRNNYEANNNRVMLARAHEQITTDTSGTPGPRALEHPRAAPQTTVTGEMSADTAPDNSGTRMSGVMGMDSYMFIVSDNDIIRILEVKPYNIYLLEFNLTAEGLCTLIGA